MIKKFLAFFMVFAFVGFIYAETKFIGEGMKQVDFAKLIISEAGLEKFLPFSPTEKDYFKLLGDFGIEPVNGWNQEGIITKEDVIYMLDYSEEEAQGFDFDELYKRLISLIKEVSSLNEESYYFPEE